MDTIEKSALYEYLYKEYPDIVGTEDICKMLNINKKRAYQLIHSGKIPRIPCSKTILVAKVFVINYVLQSAQDSDG